MFSILESCRECLGSVQGIWSFSWEWIREAPKSIWLFLSRKWSTVKDYIRGVSRSFWDTLTRATSIILSLEIIFGVAEWVTMGLSHEAAPFSWILQILGTILVVISIILVCKGNRTKLALRLVQVSIFASGMSFLIGGYFRWLDKPESKFRNPSGPEAWNLGFTAIDGCFKMVAYTHLAHEDT